MRVAIVVVLGCITASAAVYAGAAETQRQADIARRGKDVMPFDLNATTHIFTKSTDGGTQKVVAKDPNDAVQIKLAREHLVQIREEFLRGDFSGPSEIHGDAMPGLAELKAAKPGQLAIGYSDVKGGGELTYKTSDEKLVEALHEWFDAQLSDHGSDATEGHKHHHMDQMPKT
jgi:hypothetical protein